MIHIILLAKAAIAAQPATDMAALTERLAARGVVASSAFTEQGTPSLRAALAAAADGGATSILVVPLILPTEPGLAASLTRAVARWRAAEPRLDGIAVRIGPSPLHAGGMAPLLDELVAAAGAAAPLPIAADKPLGSVVPDHARRLLVCQGSQCNDRGAALVWGHLRNEQARLGLREAASMMSAKTSCLGPCNLAPVVQAYPEGVYYGGVDEAGIDRIIAEHMLGGSVVADLAYSPTGRKQLLRG